MKSFRQFIEESKSSKEEADYRDKAVGSDHCAICSMFRNPDQCTAVEGTINPQGHCKYFERK